MTIPPEIYAGLSSAELLEYVVIKRLGFFEAAGLPNDPLQLRQRTRKRHIMLSRMVCMYLLEHYKVLPTQTSIASRYGQTHAMVVHARRVLKNALEGHDNLLPAKDIRIIKNALENLGYGHKQSD